MENKVGRVNGVGMTREGWGRDGGGGLLKEDVGTRMGVRIAEEGG